MASDIERHELITRREAIFRVSAMLGGAALVGQSAMLAGCTADHENDTKSAAANPLFNQSDIALLDEIAETILPETSTPGAKAAGVGPFIAVMVADTYYTNDQEIFRLGLQDLEARCLAMHGAQFQSATPAERLLLLEELDAEQYQYMHTRADNAPAHYFRMLKELSLLGYFTSETGYMQALRYLETPARFDPCVPYVAGEKAWADHA
jgi:hypothetical protein